MWTSLKFRWHLFEVYMRALSKVKLLSSLCHSLDSTRHNFRNNSKIHLKHQNFSVLCFSYIFIFLLTFQWISNGWDQHVSTCAHASFIQVYGYNYLGRMCYPLWSIPPTNFYETSLMLEMNPFASPRCRERFRRKKEQRKKRDIDPVINRNFLQFIGVCNTNCVMFNWLISLIHEHSLLFMLWNRSIRYVIIIDNKTLVHWETTKLIHQIPFYPNSNSCLHAPTLAF